MEKQSLIDQITNLRAKVQETKSALILETKWSQKQVIVQNQGRLIEMIVDLKQKLKDNFNTTI